MHFHCTGDLFLLLHICIYIVPHFIAHINMSFLGGAECSTAGNPLTQFTKHVQDDKSLQRDRLVGRGPGMQEGMRSRGMMGGQDQVRVQNSRRFPTVIFSDDPVN